MVCMADNSHYTYFDSTSMIYVYMRGLFLHIYAAGILRVRHVRNQLNGLVYDCHAHLGVALRQVFLQMVYLRTKVGGVCAATGALPAFLEFATILRRTYSQP